MSAKSALNKALFIPNDERMLAAVQVKRRTKKKIPFLATGGPGDYTTFICLSGNVLLHRISAVSPLMLLLLRLSDMIKLPALTNLSYKHE